MPDIPEYLTKDCRDFLVKCFNYSLKERLTIEELKKHPFIVNNHSSSDSHSSSLSARFKKRKTDNIKDHIQDLSIKNKFPCPKNIGKRHKIGSHFGSIAESGLESPSFRELGQIGGRTRLRSQSSDEIDPKRMTDNRHDKTKKSMTFKNSRTLKEKSRKDVHQVSQFLNFRELQISNLMATTKTQE